MEPREHRIFANGLTHHVLEWGEGTRTVVLLHGFLDQAFGFDAIARRLADRGLRVLAPDFRGHGETDWVGPGGYYHFPDYTLDLESWLNAFGVDGIDLVGHSMGGTVATMYAGIRPKRVRTLTSIEGLGPMESAAEDAPDRFVRWFEGVERVRRRTSKPIPSYEDALERMRVMHPTLPDALGLSLVRKALKPHASGVGHAWRFDPLHQTQSPVPFRLELYRAFLARIEAPTLVLVGENGLRLPDEDARIALIPQVRKVELPGQGHMVHWHAPAEVAELLAGHVASVALEVEPDTD